VICGVDESGRPGRRNRSRPRAGPSLPAAAGLRTPGRPQYGRRNSGTAAGTATAPEHAELTIEHGHPADSLLALTHDHGAALLADVTAELNATRQIVARQGRLKSASAIASRLRTTRSVSSASASGSVASASSGHLRANLVVSRCQSRSGHDAASARPHLGCGGTVGLHAGRHAPARGHGVAVRSTGAQSRAPGQPDARKRTRARRGDA
jgi:hypothetical protein